MYKGNLGRTGMQWIANPSLAQAANWFDSSRFRKIITQGVHYGIQGNWCLFQSKKDRALQEKS